MEISTAGHKTICVPAPSEADYQKLIQKGSTFRSYLDPLIESYPELFPVEISNGYWLHDSLQSKKLNLTTRRIQMVTSKSVYQVRPDFALPYMVGKTDDVEKGLYLRRFGVPFDALAYVFGRDSSYWYRLYQSLGRFSIVGTTVKDPDALPINLLADQKHSWRLGERIFIPTTVGAGCLLGADIVNRAETPDLVNGYGRFRAGGSGLESQLSTSHRQYGRLGAFSKSLGKRSSLASRSCCVFCIASWIFSSVVERPNPFGRN